MYPPETSRRSLVGAEFFNIFFFFPFCRIGFIIGLVANADIDAGIGNVEFSIEESFSDVANLPPVLQGALGNIIGELNLTVNDLIGSVEAIPSQYVGPSGSMTALVHTTTAGLRQLQLQFDALNSLAENLVFPL